MIDAVATEWLKLRTVRSTYGLLATVVGCVAVAAALAWYAVGLWDGLSEAQRAHFSLAPLPDLTSWMASLCLGVLGVLAATGEYGSGMISTTLVAMPGRRTVLAAKATVIGMVGLVVGLGALVATAAAARLIIAGRPITGQEASDHPATLFAMGLSVAMFALLGLALGMITRSAAAAIATLSALWYVLPIVAHNLPAPWAERVGSVLPTALAGELAGTRNPDSVFGSLLPPWAALLTMLAWVLLPLAGAAVLFTRRDAR